MWTSIATGKTADKHGVLGFIQPRPDGQGVQPVLGSSRKTKAMWNILMQQGLRCAVIGWWPSHPAERLNGVCISSFYHRAGGLYGQPWPLAPGAVQPPALAELLPFLPSGYRYRVIFMERNLREILASQQSMLERLGSEAGDTETLGNTFQRQLDLVQRQLARRRDVQVLYLPHRGVIEHPREQAAALARFIGGEFDPGRAAAAVDRGLYRHAAAAADAAFA